MKELGLVPLRNFAQVDENIYRSAQPEYGYEWRWLKNVLDIGLIVNLRSESEQSEHGAKMIGAGYVHYPIKDHLPPTQAQAEAFMELIRTTNKPILFHCEHGQGRTSTFCILARMAKGMSYEDAIKEEKDRFHYEFHHPAQLEFLNQFNNQIQVA